jgi:outer membrane receptor for ferrienterochelin and colicins
MLRRFFSVLALHSPRRLLKPYLKPDTRCPVMMLSALLLGFWSSAHAAVVSGRVTDAATGQPLEGASVTVAGFSAHSAANRSGGYTLLEVSPGQWSVTASLLGYQPEIRTLKIAGSDTLRADFRLQEQSIPLNEIVVTATRTLRFLKDVPVTTELVTRNDIQRRAASSVGDALSSEIGLDVSDGFEGRGAMMQGVDPNKVLILVDGNRVIGRVNGSIDLDQISVGNVKQIEVVKGSVSTLYGSEAIGGVINVITQPPTEPFKVIFDLNGGGWAPDGGKPGLRSHNWSPAVSVSARTGKLGINADARYTRIGLIDIDPSTNHTDGVDATDRLNNNLRLDYHFSEPISLIATGQLMSESKAWVEDNGLVSALVSYDDKETNTRYNGSLELLCTPATSERYSAKLYYTANDHEWDKWTQRKWGTPRITDFSSSKENYTEFSGLLTRPLPSNQLITFGSDVYWWDISANASLGGITSPYSKLLTAWDALLQDEWQFGPKWTLVPGMRYEYHQVYGSHWSPRVSAMYEPLDNLRIRASAGMGYRAPSAKELYFVFNHSSAGYVVYGNPNLKPEESSNYTLSFEHNYSNSSVARLSFFLNDMHNLIDFDSIGVSDDYYTGIFRYNNIVSAWTRGFELERGFRPLKKLDVKLAYSYMQSLNRETNFRLINRPEHTARWDLTYRSGVWTTKIWGKYVGRALFQDIYQTDAQITSEWSPAYQLWNAVVTRDLGNDTEVYVKIENLMDHTHPRYGPREGRVVSIGAKWAIR